MTIDKPRQLPALKDLWQQAFGDTPAFIDGFFRTGFSPDRCRCLYVGDRLAAALYWFDCLWKDKHIAYVYAVATDTAFRGQGLCRRLMEDTHSYLRHSGYAGAILVPGTPDLFALYKKLGYIPCCPMETVTVSAGATPAPVKPVSVGDYTASREQRLPTDAVWQDSTALTYGETFLSFYESGRSVFCGVVEENAFIFQEFIGDMEDIPEIIPYFNCRSGIVSIPGGHPRAMYLALDEDTALPTYFGIPLN